MSVNSKMTAIADAIRAKTGGTGLLTLDDMAIEIASITGGGGTTLTVTTNEGATVTVTNGSETYTGVGPVAVFEGLVAGIWTVTVALEGATASQQVELGSESVKLNVASIYGIRRDVNISSPSWERTDKAVGLSASASVDLVAGSSDFDNCYPWSEIQRETLPTGDVMVKIPKFYFQRYQEYGLEYIKISDTPVDGFKLHPLFNHGGVECDCAYVGAYKTSSNNKSVTGVKPTVNTTRTSFRANAQAKGVGWGILDIAAVSAIQMLILVEFATNDVQTAIGRGYCDLSSSSQAVAVGNCDDVLNLTGIPYGTDGRIDVVWRGIEGFWGNVWELIDGVNVDNGIYYVCNDQSKYAESITTDYTQLSFSGATNWTRAYITEVGIDDGNNEHVMLPSAAGSGSDSTYHCDACWCSAGQKAIVSGGRWSYGSSNGLFALYMGLATTGAGSDVGSRLLYIPS